MFALLLALVAGLAKALGAMLSAAQSALIGMLKKYRVSTAGSSPMHITQASDGIFWFTESFVNDQITLGHKIGRITPAGQVAAFDVCDFCFPGDIVQGSDGLLYFSSNDGLGRISTGDAIQPFIVAPFSVGGNALDAHGDDIRITDFNDRSIWRYDVPTGEFTEFPIGVANTFGPHDVAVAENGVV